MKEQKNDRLTSRGRLSLLFCLLLAPLIRQIPGSVVPRAGSAAWLSVVLAVPPLLFGAWVFSRMLSRCREGETLCALLLRGLGKHAGRPFVFLLALWLSLYAGFVLRAGADRFVAAVYTESPVWLFAAVMLVLVLPAALGRLRVLGRCAEISALLLGAVFVLVFLFALPGMDADNLLPLTGDDLPGALGGVPGALSPFVVALSLALVDRKTAAAPSVKTLLAALLPLIVLALLLSLTTVGTFGAELTGSMNYPFFVMIRGIRLFHLLERVEALIIAQWVAADFLLLGVLLRGAGEAFSLTFCGEAERGARVGIAAAAALAALGARLCAPTAFALQEIARTLVPAVNAAALLFVLLAYLIARARKTV